MDSKNKQAYLNHSMITFHVNVEEIVERLCGKIKLFSKQFFRIGTGEASDSLALDHIFICEWCIYQPFGGLMIPLKGS